VHSPRTNCGHREGIASMCAQPQAELKLNSYSVANIY